MRAADATAPAEGDALARTADAHLHALHAAIAEGDTTTAASALAAGADPNIMYDAAARRPGTDAAHSALNGLLRYCFLRPSAAAWPAAEAMTRLLLEAGADVNAPLSYSSNAAFASAIVSRVSMPGEFPQASRWRPLFRMALAAGAQPDQHALVTWARLGAADVVQEVIAGAGLQRGVPRGAGQPQSPANTAGSIASVSDDGSRRPTRPAVSTRPLSAVSLDAHVRTPFGVYTPLLAAVDSGDVATAEALLAAGADANASPGVAAGAPERPLTLAAQQQDSGAAMTRLLLEHGADPDSRRCDSTLTPALLVATSLAAFSDEAASAAATLIASGANVSAADSAGVTPLHAAVLCGAFDVAEWLTVAGADRHAVTVDGRRPADMLGPPKSGPAYANGEGDNGRPQGVGEGMLAVARQSVVAEVQEAPAADALAGVEADTDEAETDAVADGAAVAARLHADLTWLARRFLVLAREAGALPKQHGSPCPRHSGSGGGDSPAQSP
jgi:hypothetical protein